MFFILGLALRTTRKERKKCTFGKNIVSLHFVTVHNAMNPYILLYKTLLPRRYKHYLQRAGGNTDMCHETLLHGTFYEEYELYGFADKDEAERREYLTDAVRNKICRHVNSRKGERTVADKWLTYCRLKEFYHRRVMLLDSDSTIAEAAALGCRAGELVAKPANQCGGRGVQLLSGGDSKEEWLSLLKDKQGWVVEERIEQDAALAQWNPSSVNTIRINTFQRNGQVTLFTSFIRTGRSGSFVDNGFLGGLFASIDTETGVIFTDGYDEKGLPYPAHPDSGVPYRGTQIPRWQELRQLSEKMAKAMPDMVYIGWDMALTPNGWEPVEANRGEFVAQQVTQGHGMRHEFERLCGYSHSARHKNTSL